MSHGSLKDEYWQEELLRQPPTSGYPYNVEKFETCPKPLHVINSLRIQAFEAQPWINGRKWMDSYELLFRSEFPNIDLQL